MKRWRSWIIYIVAGWISLAIIGYGIALTRYGNSLPGLSKLMSSGAATTGSVSVEGRVSWSSVQSKGIRFKVEGNGDELLVPAELMGSGDTHKEFERYLRPGTKVAVTFEPTRHWVVELKVNPKTVFEKQMITSQNTAPQLERATESLSKQGKSLMIVGALFLPLVFLGNLGWKRVRVRLL